MIPMPQATAEPAALPPLIAALLDPARYPHAAPAVELVETHISWVLLAGEFAYKIKKPLALGFLDFSTLEARRHYCHEELRLNRATAPQLYLEVVSLTGSAAAPQFGGEDAPFEYALKMRRFAADALLDAVAHRGALDAALVDRLAAVVAAFHDRCPRAGAAGSHGSLANVALPALDNFTQIAALGAPVAERAQLAQLRAWTAAESTRLAPVFAARVVAGQVRECHGDLHLGNIALIDGEPTPFDCIEFNPEFRWIDVMSELAFLVMDLCDHGLPALAWRCLNRYLEAGGDYEGLAVLRYYLVYRAMVRAKIALIHARQPHGIAVRRADVRSFNHHLAVAARFSRPAAPALILMHGLSGAGKTTVARALAEGIGAVRVRTDVERKRLYGLAATAHSGSGADAGIYTAAATQRTYARLNDIAAMTLAAGWRIVVDAACLRRGDRARFRDTALAAGVPLLLVRCTATDADLRERLDRRAAEGGDASEATADLLERQLRQLETPGSDEADALFVFDRRTAVADLIERVRARCDVTAMA